MVIVLFIEIFLRFDFVNSYRPSRNVYSTSVHFSLWKPPTAPSVRYHHCNFSTSSHIVFPISTLLCQDAPRYTLFSIDTQMFTVGLHFKGVKMIPLGSHFVYCSSSNKDGNAFCPFVGFFVIASPAVVFAFNWVQQEQRVVRLSR